MKSSTRSFQLQDFSSMNRRHFARLSVAASGLGVFSSRASGKVVKPEPGVKLAVQAPANPNAEQLLFLRQLGIRYVSVGAPKDMRTAEGFKEIKRRYSEAGIAVYNIGNTSVHNMPEVVLGLPGRDRKIDEYIQYLRNLAAAGIYYTTYAHMGNGIWSSGRTEVRGASARVYDRASPEKRGAWDGQSWQEPLSHGRRFTQEEIWENYTYFIRKVVPVAEELGIRIGIHPDDPPEPELAGVPRCIFSSFEGYRKAFEIAASPNIGMCLCCGCWLEGGPLMGRDLVDTIRYFGRREKIWKVHFRNVDAPLPRFVETFMDNGYYDMARVAKALVEVNFSGIVILDHSPSVVGGFYSQTAYGIAYMRALFNFALGGNKI